MNKITIYDPPTNCKEDGYYHLKFVGNILIGARTKWVARDGFIYNLYMSEEVAKNIKNTYKNDTFILAIKNYRIIKIIKNVTKGIVF